MAGGGSKLPTLCARVAAALGIDPKRAALAGGYFQSSAYSDTLALSDPEYTTPLGIAVSAGLGLISDSYQVLLNGSPAKLFRSGSLTVLELLMMNGYRYSDLIGRSGTSFSTASPLCSPRSRTEAPTGSWICWSGPVWTSNIWTALCSRR